MSVLDVDGGIQLRIEGGSKNAEERERRRRAAAFDVFDVRK
ncbi:hypothetical protein [Streptomyces sp. UNOB3_S3]|nr:hypothetical protein [Streptomyces sp. UNOB3_S3]